MSLITACPACQTQFEVSDEQLQAYAGKVRCGECNHVFDARSSLVEAADSEEQTIAAPVETGVAVAEMPTAVLDPVLADTNEVGTTKVYAVTGDGEKDQEPGASWDLPTGQETESAIPEFLRNVSLDEDSLPLPEKTSRAWVFPTLSGVLALTVLFQLIYFSRVSLAANYPQTKPVLQSVCKLAHCTVTLPHDITQLTIDDADIQEHREREGVLVFSSVLINHGAVSQAYPKIELTLTNMADEPVLRKIVKPAEYLPEASNIAQGLAAQQEQPVKISLGVEDKAVTGFRVAIAY